MKSIGETLREARELKGISLDQAEEDTKIRKRYLQALEDGNYDILPGMVYAKGFLRNYANYLSLNQEEIMMEYKLLNTPVRENDDRPDIEEVINKRRADKRLNRRMYLVTAIVASVAVLTFAVYSLIFDNSKSVPVTGDLSEQPETVKAAESPKSQADDQKKTEDTKLPSDPGVSKSNPQESSSKQENNTGSISDANETPVGQQQVKVVLRGSETSWIKVYVDGKADFTGRLEPGEIKEFTAEEKIKFRLGNAGGVAVNVNGQELGTLGPVGAVVDREYFGQTNGTIEESR